MQHSWNHTSLTLHPGVNHIEVDDISVGVYYAYFGRVDARY